MTGRSASAKFFIGAYKPLPIQWDLRELPENTGLPDQVVAELVGSRKPILFIEGANGSVDLTIYGAHYSGFTIIPIGSCEDVIRSVDSHRNSQALHWLVIRGLVDADDRGSDELTFLRNRDIYVLPVTEIENIFALPDIFLSLARALMCPNPEILLESLKTAVLSSARDNLESVSARYTSRQIDRKLKKVLLDAKNIEVLKSNFETAVSLIHPAEIFAEFKAKLESFIDAGDLAGVLRLYDNKGLLSLVARTLGLTNLRSLLEKVTRLLSERGGEELRQNLRNALPSIPL